MFLVADIIRVTQPKIYNALLEMLTVETIIGVGYIPPDEDELPEFRRMKRLMEERKAVRQ